MNDFFDRKMTAHIFRSKKVEKILKKVLTIPLRRGIINKLTGTEDERKVRKTGGKQRDEASKADRKLHLVN